MKKRTVLLVLSALAIILIGPGIVMTASVPRPGAPAGSGRLASVGEDLIKLLPRSTIGVVVLNLKRILEIEAIDKALQAPQAKEAFDELVKMIGIDLKKDIAYVGFGVPASEGTRLFSMPGPGSDPRRFGIIVNVKYDQARLQGLIKEKAPAAKEETYDGMTIYSNLGGGENQVTPAVLGEMGKMSFQVAFLDASHVVLGSDDQSIKGIIDVYRNKAEPLAENPEMTALVGRVEKSGLAWSAVSYPAELVKKAVDANPQLKFMAGITGITMAFDDKISGLFADIRTFAGTKEQNADFASILNGFKAVGVMAAAKEPALEELLSGIAITSGKEYARLTLTVSYDTLGKALKLAEPKGMEWQSLSYEALVLCQKGDYDGAAEMGKRALEVAEKDFGPDHPDTAGSLYNLGLVYIKQHKDAEAEPLFKRALAITEKALGPDDARVATILEALSSLYFIQGQYPEAEPLYKRLLAVREKTLGPDHPDVAETLFNLGGLYYFQDRYEEGEPLLKRSLAINEKALGPDDPRTAKVLNGLARHYYFQDRYAEAEPLFKRSLAIREKALGPDHPDVAESLSNLADLYGDQDRYAEAEPLSKRALAILEKALDPDDPGLAYRLRDLAKLYQRLGRYVEAEPLSKRALAIREKALGPDHLDVAESLNDLAVLYHVQGRYAEAEPLYKRALAIREKTLGPDDREVADSLKILAELYRSAKRDKEAQELEARAARIRSIKR
jgi:tetratricopeptide (TPR) repeat protein